MPGWGVNISDLTSTNERDARTFTFEFTQFSTPRVVNVDFVVVEFDIGSAYATPGVDFTLPGNFVFLGNFGGRARYRIDNTLTQSELGYRYSIINDNIDDGGNEIISIHLVEVRLRDGTSDSINGNANSDRMTIIDDDGTTGGDPMPDLTVSDIILPSSFEAGESFTARVVIQNIGDANTSNPFVRLELRDNQVSTILWSSGDTVVSGRVGENGATLTSGVFTIPGSVTSQITDGGVFLTATVRTSGAEEKTRSNNSRQEGVGVTVPDKADLIIEDVTLEKVAGSGDPRVGDDVKVRFATENAGTLAAGQSVSLVEVQDADGNLIASRDLTILPLDVGGRRFSEFSFTIPNDAAEGNFTISVTANANGAVDESNTTNNTVTEQLIIEGGNRAPEATDDLVSLQFEVDNSYFISNAQLLANDSDPDGDAIEIDQVFFTGANTGGIWQQVDDGFIAKPGQGVSTMVLTYVVRDSDGATDNATLTLRIGAQPNNAPIARADAFSVAYEADGQYFVSDAQLLANDTDPDGDTLSISNWNLSRNDSGGDWQRTEGGFFATPESDGGTMVLSYQISDGNGGTDWTSLTLQTGRSPLALVFSLTPANLAVEESDGTLTFTVSRTLSDEREVIYVSTVGGSASANEGDYQALRREALMFEAGAAEASFGLILMDDGFTETDEVFQIILQEADNLPASSYLDRSVVTISGNDVPADYSAPVIGRSDEDAFRVEHDFGMVGDGTFNFEGRVGGNDQYDSFSLNVDRAGTLTVTLSTLYQGPRQVVQEIQLERGENKIVLSPTGDPDLMLDYDLNFAVELEPDPLNIEDWIDDNFADALSLTSSTVADWSSFVRKIAELVDEPAKASGAFKAFLKKFKPLGIVIETGDAFDNVISAAAGGKDWRKQLFVEIADLTAGALPFVLGAGVGAGVAAGVAAAGITVPVWGSALIAAGIFAASTGANFVYETELSDGVRNAAVNFFDDWFSNDGPPDLDRYVSQSTDTQVDITPYIFDEAYYLEEYPEAQDAVNDGTFQSIYAYYLAVGVGLGHKINSDAAPINADSIRSPSLVNAQSLSGTAVLETDLNQLVGDNVSTVEKGLTDQLFAQTDISTAPVLSEALSALANRVARDWGLNSADGAVDSFEASSPSEWATTLSTGEDWRDALSGLVGESVTLGNNLNLIAVASSGGTSADILQEILELPGVAEKLTSVDVQSIGIAEWGGLWVIITDSFLLDDAVTVGSAPDRSFQYGSNDADVMYGGSAWSVVRLGDGADTFVGGRYRDVVNGEDGNDWLSGEAGDDYLNGGNGIDTADYSSAQERIVVNLTDGVISGLASGDVNDGWGNTDTLNNIEVIFGSQFSDLVYGSAAAETLLGEAGNDRLRGGDGNDVLLGGSGADDLNGGGGFDTVSYADDISGISVNLDTIARRGIAAQTAIDGWGDTDSLVNFQTLIGSAFADNIIGRTGSETLIGGAGDDEIRAQAGNDTLVGGLGNDYLNGQSGLDIVDYSAAGAAIDVDMASGTAMDGDGGMDTLIGIERIIGSDFDDMFTGGNANDFAYGGAGDDLAFGGAGNDIYFGEAGNDELRGEADSDRLYGGDGDDLIVGGDGVDILDGGAGNDTIDGGNDGDRIFARDGDDVISGGAGFDIINGQEGNDTINGGDDRDILRGQAGDDTIFGDGGDDTLSGDIGADVLDGGVGADLLKGGDGDDTLTGGAGNDRLIGGDGIDTAVFSGNLADYDINFRNGVVRITDLNGTDGFDKLTEVEFLQFADGVIDVAGL